MNYRQLKTKSFETIGVTAPNRYPIELKLNETLKDFA